MKATRILLYVLVVSLLFTACKTSRHAQRKAQKKLPQTEVVKPAPGTPVPTTPSTSTPSSQQSQTQQPYTWVSYRGTANIDFDGKKYQCNYYVVNRIDSILYLNLSLNFLGVEVARMVATPQEVTFVNKLSSEYYQGDYAYVEKYLKAKADFYTLQAIFNGDEAKLKTIPGVSVSYHPVVDETSNRPFFDSFSISMNGGRRKADMQVKNLKFNTPGPTSIKIPENFKLMTP